MLCARPEEDQNRDRIDCDLIKSLQWYTGKTDSEHLDFSFEVTLVSFNKAHKDLVS